MAKWTLTKIVEELELKEYKSTEKSEFIADFLVDDEAFIALKKYAEQQQEFQELTEIA